MSKTVFQLIETLADTLSKTETLMAQFVQTQPQTLLRSSLQEVAQLAGVSEPSVIRFCRKLGFEGFKDFKLVLAQDLVSTETYGNVSVTPSDTMNEITNKVFNSTIEKLVRIRNTLDPERLEEAAKRIASARKIEFHALGSSGDIAVDAHHKFFRLGFTCMAYTDSGMQQISARTLTSRDVLIVISSSGETRELLKGIQVAREAGAYLIGITASTSTIASLCDLVLAVETIENGDIHSPIMSRVAHLLILDTIAIGVTLLASQ